MQSTSAIRAFLNLGHNRSYKSLFPANHRQSGNNRIAENISDPVHNETVKRLERRASRQFPSEHACTKNALSEPFNPGFWPFRTP
jgi:hypothetical protein